MALHTLKAQIRSKMFFDLVLLCAIFIGSFILLSYFDALEWLLKISRQHAYMDLDVVVSALVVLCFLFGIFSYRRWQDVRKLSLYCEELSMIDPITMLPNRRVISRLLEEVREGKTKQNCFPLSLILIDIEGLKAIQAQFGNAVVEQSIHELVYRFSLLLVSEQLISYRNTSQCFVFCPEFDSLQAEILCQKLTEVELKGRQTTLQMLNIKLVSVTLNQPQEIDWALEKLEDLLYEKHLKDQHRQE